MFNVLALQGSPLVIGHAGGAVENLLARLNAWASTEPRTAAELTELADSYESTQPSYASDLRAVARQLQR